MSTPLGRSVLADRTFFDALLRLDDPRHDDALVRYEELLADYESGSTVLVTHEDTLAETVDPARARRIAAVFDIVSIEGDVRREMRRIRSDDTSNFAAGLDDSQLATIVLLVRRSHDVLVTFDPAVAGAGAAAIAAHLAPGGHSGHRSRRRLRAVTRDRPS